MAPTDDLDRNGAVLVLRDREIRERGSHAKLMAAGGLYAELFELQARACR
ncbi:MAG TPA: hypothetical protein VGH96_19080 [Streptosporangiaceae bacterium]